MTSALIPTCTVQPGQLITYRVSWVRVLLLLHALLALHSISTGRQLTLLPLPLPLSLLLPPMRVVLFAIHNSLHCHYNVTMLKVAYMTTRAEPMIGGSKRTLIERIP